MTASISDIRDFIALKRIALIGASRDPKHFSRYLFLEMSKKGYDLVPPSRSKASLATRACRIFTRLSKARSYSPRRKIQCASSTTATTPAFNVFGYIRRAAQSVPLLSTSATSRACN